MSERSLRQVLDYLGRFGGFGRDARLLLALGFFISITIGLSDMTLPLYLRSLGYSPDVIGLMLGTSAFTSFVVLLPAGILADHYGNKRVLIMSILAYSCGFAVYATLAAFQFLLVASILIGFSWGSYIGPWNAILAERSRDEDRSYVFSFNSFLSALGVFAGYILGGSTETLGLILQLSTEGVFRNMFFAAFLSALVCLTMLCVLREKSVPRPRQRVLQITSWRFIGFLSVVNILIGFGAGTLIPLLPLYLSVKFLATEASIGVLLASSSVTTGVANLLAPRLSEKIGDIATITLTQCAAILPLILIPYSGAFPISATLYVIRTTLMNMSSPTMSTYTVNGLSKEERASALGLTTMSWNGAYAIGTTVSGAMISVNLDLPICNSAAFYTLSSVLFYCGARRLRQMSTSS